ncbi:MAG TPA: cytochrome c biogenesis protein CcdA [Candidatus Pacearchaeota archaeon]|nr:cytochrome c biogenesis protein CcdA [Candidatus Pacearchaeota archaeon]
MKLKKENLRIALIIVLTALILNLNITSAETLEEEYPVNLHVFYGQGCPHCGAMFTYLESIRNEYPTLNVYKHEVYQNNQERELFQELAVKFNTEIQGVPTAFIDDKVIVGFSNDLSKILQEQIERCLIMDCGDPLNKIKTNETQQIVGDSSPSPEKKDKIEKLTIPVVIAAAAVDAINPCAFAVLIILMTAALSIANKKRALKFGLAFTLSIYIAYFLMGLGLFSAIQATGLGHKFYIFVTALAVIVGLFNIKDYFWYGKGFLMEVPLSWRPKMKKLLNGATSPFGAFLVGFAVSLFELPCTGGPYIVILGLLAKEVTRSTGIMYLLLYNLVFVIPLIILSIVIYKGLSTTEKLENVRQSKLRLLHLISGLLMLIIAAVMILSIIKGWV